MHENYRILKGLGENQELDYKQGNQMSKQLTESNEISLKLKPVFEETFYRFDLLVDSDGRRLKEAKQVPTGEEPKQRTFC